MTITRRAVFANAMALGAAGVARPAIAATQTRVERWGVFELALAGPSAGNPFRDTLFSAVLEGAGQTIEVPGFYDGDGLYRLRFSPPETGGWRWTTRSNAPALSGKSGRFTATAPTQGNHGPVQVSKDGFHFTYADGTPFRQIGTTCYSWALQSEEKCRQTLKTLSAAPFNKMRMLVFPNVASVATDPFVRKGEGPGNWDATRFDPAYFRRYEDRIIRLGELGIEADVILYQPYDPKRGYSDMKREDDEHYIRYVAARFGAYRNVWWSMANEFDLIESKTDADWDHLFTVLADADPHSRLRSIHNIHRYYDQRKPWITHASVQNGAAVLDPIRAELHRAFAEKPVIFDEVVYEGNIDKRWGNLTGEEMVERFWHGLIGGTYVGHSETYAQDRNPDHSWLGQGGTLQGTSAPRLAFLKRIMEEGPAPGIDAVQPWWNYRVAGKEGAYYLLYFGTESPAEWEIRFPSKSDDAIRDYEIDVIDTWNMTVEPQGRFRMARKDEYDIHSPVRPAIALPGRPYMAVRLRAA
ncbi:DUF5060 domain-containing protein [Croceicoccus sp. Ery15]|uniref:DUF5060 domain-containing protein n=1 Tax=Croceicoccus sp. Ery15 TaxID=1703338 RepID=UPI001E6598C6|nr:DUF5060 domain-containing protein [Croceicoccus sp. Ery15]